MASNLYNNGLLKLLDGTIDFAADDIQVLLIASGYTFSKAHEFVSDITSEVTNASGIGYERKSLSGKTIALDGAGDRVYYDADNPSYTAIDTNEDLAAMILFKQVTSDADSPLIAMIDFPDLSTEGADVELRVSADGLFEINNTLV